MAVINNILQKNDMNINNKLKNWLVIQTYSGKEEDTAKAINMFFDREERIFFPKRKIYIKKKREYIHSFKALYPGYLFFKGTDNKERNIKLISNIYQNKKFVPFFIKVITYNGCPAICREKEMDLVFSLVNSESVIEYSKLYKQGQWIKVISGPLKGKEGIIKSIIQRKHRVRVELEILGAMRETDLSAFVIE